MEGIEDHFQANQLLFISVLDSDPDPNLNLKTLIPITYWFDELWHNKKKEKKYILKV